VHYLDLRRAGHCAGVAPQDSLDREIDSEAMCGDFDEPIRARPKLMLAMGCDTSSLDDAESALCMGPNQKRAKAGAMPG
jgi:hypothetical protein